MSVNNHKERHEFIQEEGNPCNVCMHPGTCCGFCIPNSKYVAKNSSGETVATVEEDAGVCCRACCQPWCRTTKTKITINDNGNQVVYFADKPCAMAHCPAFACCFTCYPKVKVTDFQGRTVGTIAQNGYQTACCCKYSYDAYAGDTTNKTQLRWTVRKCAINCPACCYNCQCLGKMCSEINFEVKDNVGSWACDYQKVYNECWNECCTSKDKYKFQFPSESLDDRAMWLAQMHFIDLMHFEHELQP